MFVYKYVTAVFNDFSHDCDIIVVWHEDFQGHCGDYEPQHDAIM